MFYLRVPRMGRLGRFYLGVDLKLGLRGTLCESELRAELVEWVRFWGRLGRLSRRVPKLVVFGQVFASSTFHSWLKRG